MDDNVSTTSRRRRRYRNSLNNNGEIGKGHMMYDEEYVHELKRQSSRNSIDVMDTIHEEWESSKHSSNGSLHESSLKNVDAVSNGGGSVKSHRSL